MCNGFWASFTGAKKPGRGAYHPPLAVPGLSLGRAIPLPPSLPSWHVMGQLVLHQLHETLSVVPTWSYNPHMKTSYVEMCDRELGIQKQCTVHQQGAGIPPSTVKQQSQYPSANMKLVHIQLGIQCHGSLCSGCRYSETSHNYNMRQLFWHPGVDVRMYCCRTHSLAYTADRHTSQVASFLKHARILWPSVIFFTLLSSLMGWNEFTQNIHGCTGHQWYQILYCPTDTLNYINCRVIKNTFKI